ncbi:response regulator [Alteromonas sp. BL110]|uniref:response regulator n=1 Tax=Alteromonas sp. BL110 TaxID=1714845 RepID=UPI000E4EAEC2|nr:response regulator [Alteromonas sp. BL110]AXT39984.1 response regulator [Alteromonas sp. BL110]RKM79213.1 response regulator [Alteromonas sp. BL110]
MSTEHPVLIVEDEEKIAQILVDFFALEGFNTKVLHSGEHVISSIKESTFSAIILDRMLPAIDGLTLCKQIRQFSNVPILMLTARIDEIDRLIGLGAGADDYICKPFSPREVVARVQAILRRTQSQNSSLEQSQRKLVHKDIILDLDTYVCERRNETIELTPVEFRLLKTFIEKPGHVFSREQLMDKGYVDGRIVSNRTIDSHMKNLRHKLMQDDHTSPLQAVYGIGYKLS